jgi:hypothetical protein
VDNIDWQASRFPLRQLSFQEVLTAYQKDFGEALPRGRDRPFYLGLRGPVSTHAVNSDTSHAS